MNFRAALFTKVWWLVLLSIVGTVFLFTFSISRYPAGDDPGFHTSVLAYLLERETTNFELPYFPDLHQVWGSERFVTKLALVSLSRLTGIEDVFQLHIAFTTLCLAAALIPMFLLMVRITGSRLAAAGALVFLGFTKFYQESFLEGSYDQYTGLLLLTTGLYALYRWREDRGRAWLVLATILMIGLYKTHELGFLIGLLAYVLVAVEAAWKRSGRRGLWIGLGLSTLLLGIFGALRPQSFAPNATGYPIEALLGSSEGTTLTTVVLLVFGFGLLIFRQRNRFVIAWFMVAFILAQSFLLDSPFYSYRFNLYLVQAFAVLFAIALTGLLRYLRRYHWYIQTLVFGLVMLSALAPTITHVTNLGRWLTSQSENPASVILNADAAAFRWAATSTESSDVFLASYKWGYYLPALARRAVILDEAVGGDSRDVRFDQAQQAKQVFVTDDAKTAHDVAKALGVKYVVWGAAQTRFQDRFELYRRRKFGESEYFSTVYARAGTYIYEVR